MEFFEMTHKGLHKSVLHVFQYLAIAKEKKILDVGCGNGNFVHELHTLGYSNLHACDGFLENEKLLELCSFQKQNLNLNLEYADSSFDTITFTEVIEHLENPNHIVHEIHRILRSDGILLLSTPNVFTLVSRLLFLFEGSFLQFRKSDTRFENWPGHIAPFFLYIFAEVFKEKFTIEAEYYSNFIVPIFGWEMPWRNKFFGNTVILVLRKI